jgi:hypothetical protein
MSFLIDIYVLAPGRSKDQINQFLTRFVPNRSTSTSEYEVRAEDDSTVATFETAEKMIEHCESHSDTIGQAY